MVRIMIRPQSSIRRLLNTRRRKIVASILAALVILPIAPTVTSTTAQAATAWPLEVSSDGRHLVDQTNKPFLMTADTSWSLLQDLTEADAKRYIDLRKAQGFNTILTNITFADRTTAGPRGTAFDGDDMTKPHEEYFAGIDTLIKYAASKDMVLMIGALWTADNGGRVGGRWPTESEFETYANFLGNRYKNEGNIIWFVGGDDHPENDSKLVSMGAAINAADPNHLIAAHNSGKSTIIDSEWLDLNTYQWNSNTAPYSYEDVTELRGESPKPVMNMEPAYDPTTCCGDDKNTTPQKVRRSVWWAALSGAFGVVYGGPRETWHINSDSFDEGAINRPAATHVGNVNRILSQYPWQTLQPGSDAITGTGDGDTKVVAATTENGSLSIAYTPTPQELTVSADAAGSGATAQWFDPTTGKAIGSAEPVNGTMTMQSPGDEDAVLIVGTETAKQAPAPDVSASPTPTETTEESADSDTPATSTDSTDEPATDTPTANEPATDEPSTDTDSPTTTTAPPTTKAPVRTTTTLPTSTTSTSIKPPARDTTTGSSSPGNTSRPTGSIGSALLIEGRDITGVTQVKVTTKFGTKSITTTATVDKGAFTTLARVPAGYSGPVQVSVTVGNKTIKASSTIN